jgi:small subunit ribosomal protein S5
MDDQTIQKHIDQNVRVNDNAKRDFKGGSRGGAPMRGGRGGRTFADRPKPEFDQKILAIRRVTRVVSGGRRMTFSVAMAIGDKKGMMGVGTGKALDTALAINKAIKSAKKNMLKLKLTKKGSIPHDVKAKYSTSQIMIMPNKGKGMVSGSAIRDLLILAGIKDVSSKVLSGSKNKLNIARATMKALEVFKKPKEAVVVEAPKEAVTE